MRGYHEGDGLELNSSGFQGCLLQHLAANGYTLRSMPVHQARLSARPGLRRRISSVDISEPTEYALLGLLWDGPRHGYELHHAFDPHQELGAICHLEQALLYSQLKKLEHLGYIESTLVPQEARPPRRMVRLTEKGRRAFRVWVETPVQRLREIRLLFLLKLYFARSFGPASMHLLLRRQIEACQTLLNSLKEGLSGAADAPSAPAGIAFHDFRILVDQTRMRQTEATLGWLRELEEQETP